MPTMRQPYTIDMVIRFAINAAVVFGIVWLLGYLNDVLIPFVVALLLAYVLNPLVNVIQKWFKNRIVSVVVSLLLVLITAVLAAMLIVPLILTEMKQMGGMLTELANNSELAERAKQMLPANAWETIREYAARKEVQSMFKTDKFWTVAESLARKLLPGVWGLISGTASFLLGLIGLFVIALYLVFLLIDYRKIQLHWKQLLPDAYRETLVDFVQEFDAGMNRYFRAQAMVAGSVGVLFAVGFSLIGLPMGILLGLFIGLLNMVPYLQLIGIVPAVLLALIHALETGTDIWLVLALVAIVFVVVQAIQDGILVPRIMGGVTGLSPAVILLSLSIWGKLLGVLGLIIAIPVTCMIFAYYKRFFVRHTTDASAESQSD